MSHNPKAPFKYLITTTMKQRVEKSSLPNKRYKLYFGLDERGPRTPGGDSEVHRQKQGGVGRRTVGSHVSERSAKTNSAEKGRWRDGMMAEGGGRRVSPSLYVNRADQWRGVESTP